jgi:hypothetical protein
MSDSDRSNKPPLRGLGVAIAVGVFFLALAAYTLWWGLGIKAVDQRTYPIWPPKCGGNESCTEQSFQVAARSAAIDDTSSLFALYQLALSVFGLGGLGITFFYAHAAWTEAKRSADAAEDALFGLERPIVYGTAKHTVLDETKTFPHPDRIDLVFQNFGRGPAFLTRVEYLSKVVPKGAIAPKIDPYSVGGRALPDGVVATEAAPYREDGENLFASFSMYERELLGAGDASLWVVGFVRYDDVFEKHHISGFAVAFDPISRSFVRRGNHKRNYHHEEEAEEIPAASG